jgi:hypothetical protein
MGSEKIGQTVKEWMEGMGWVLGKNGDEETIFHLVEEEPSLGLRYYNTIYPKTATHLYLNTQKQILEAKIEVWRDAQLTLENSSGSDGYRIMLTKWVGQNIKMLEKQFKQINDQIRSME